MPVFWHFRVSFSLQTSQQPLIFDTLFAAEVKPVCNVFSVTKRKASKRQQANG